MIDANTQAMKVFVVPECGNDVAQAIVSAVPATQFEARSSRRDIQLIMGDEDFVWRDFEKSRHGRDGFAAAVHERCGNKQPDIVSAQAATTGQAKEFGFA